MHSGRPRSFFLPSLQRAQMAEMVVIWFIEGGTKIEGEGICECNGMQLSYFWYKIGFRNIPEVLKFCVNMLLECTSL